MRPFLTLVTAALLAAPLAAANEATSDCEDGQWWIGYRTTRAASQTVEEIVESDGTDVAACEGEQWDGQDNVAPGASGSCTGAFHPHPSNPSAAFCMGADANTAPGADPIQPAGARASARDADGARELYLAANVAFVGRVALYAGTCEGAGGLEGEARCRGGREVRHGLYVRDNTWGNFLFTSVNCMFSLTGCMASEKDCDQATYHDTAKTGVRSCDRDNTAFGAMLVLP